MILIVEDNEQVAEMIQTALSGYNLYNYPSGEEALRFLSYVQVYLIIPDLTLAGKLPGLELLAVIKSSPEPELRNTPVIVVSGTESTDLVSQAERLGAAPFFQKPHSPPWPRPDGGG